MPVLLVTLISRKFKLCNPMCTVGGDTVSASPANVDTVTGSGGIVITRFTATVDDIREGTRFMISGMMEKD